MPTDGGGTVHTVDPPPIRPEDCARGGDRTPGSNTRRQQLWSWPLNACGKVEAEASETAQFGSKNLYWDTKRLKDRLLRRTLRYVCLNVPYYRDLFADREATPRLDEFPIVDSCAINENLEAHMCLERFPDFYLTSGGTTGSMSLIPGIVDEIEAAHRFQTGVRPGEPVDPTSVPGVVLHLVSHEHGVAPEAQRGQPLMKLPFHHVGHAKLVRRVLEEGIVVGGRRFPVLGLTGTLLKIRRLTAYLSDTDFDPRRTLLSSIICYAFHLSDEWRQRLHGFWGVPVVDRYGLSEFFYDVPIECATCKGFHPRMTYCEFLSPEGREPVSSGDAILVLTSLHPFARILPRIRYWTGDVVRLLTRCEATDETSFLFRGRADECVLVNLSGCVEAILSPTEIVEVLDRVPGVRLTDDNYERHFYGQERRYQGERFWPGSPVFDVVDEQADGKTRHVRLLVEAAFDPAVEVGPAQELKAEILEGLGATAPAIFGRRPEGMTFDVEIVLPGALGTRGIAADG